MSKSFQIVFAVLLAFVSLADPSIKQAAGHVVMVGAYAVTILMGLAVFCFTMHQNQKRRYSSSAPTYRTDASFDEDDQ